MEQNKKRNCKICENEDDDISEWVCIREKGATTLNKASNKRMGDTVFCKGDWLHKKCRSDYINEKYISLSSKNSNVESGALSQRTRSATNTFDFRNNCFLCGTSITDREKRDRIGVVFVA